VSDVREDFREIEMAVFGMVPVLITPPRRLSGVDEDEDELATILRGID
jgi:hypothetical protein